MRRFQRPVHWPLATEGLGLGNGVELLPVQHLLPVVDKVSTHSQPSSCPSGSLWDSLLLKGGCLGGSPDGGSRVDHSNRWHNSMVLPLAAGAVKPNGHGLQRQPSQRGVSWRTTCTAQSVGVGAVRV